MADQSVFKMSGAASEKLAALQNLSHSERPSSYDQDLSKLVCSFMRPVSEANPVQRSLPTTNLEGPSEIPSRTLPFSIIKPAESWSKVGVRTVADLKTAMSSKKMPAIKSPSSDRGVDWRLRSSLYFDFHHERSVRLPYEIPGLAERAESPPLNMEGCTNLTSTEVLNAMRVLEPPKRPSPCKPYSSPRGNSPPRPQGTLPLNSLPLSAPCRRKMPARPPPESPTLKQPITAPRRKARMKFTKRRSDLEKDPLTGLLEPRLNPLAPLATSPMSIFEFDDAKEPLSENNNNINNKNYMDKYSDGVIQDYRSEYASSIGSPSSGISADRRNSNDGSTPLRPENVAKAGRRNLKATVSESSCQDSVISSSEQASLQLLQPPNEVVAEESQDVEFFDLTIADSCVTPQGNQVVAAETASIALETPTNKTMLTPKPTKERKKSTSTPVLTCSAKLTENAIRPQVGAEPRAPEALVKQDAATQTQQSPQLREIRAPVEATKPKLINLVELYKAVTLMKSSGSRSGLLLDPDLFLVPAKGPAALPQPDGMII